MEPSTDSTRVLIDALTDPRAYNHPVTEVRIIETHISWVLLAGDSAYKIKKPVSFGFVDFATLEARHAYCQDEVRLNRRLAPSIYLGVVAITGSTDQPRMGGSSPVLEYAVHMRRFDQAALFDRLLERDALEPGWMDALAVRIAAFHSSAPAVSTQSTFGSPETVLQPALDNFNTLMSSAGHARYVALEALQAWTRGTFGQLESMLASRLDDGHVRECHGDLHLGNIALIDGAPVAFDCIEFNAEFRWIDVMNEIAFLVMDLADRGRMDLGYRFLDRYLQVTGDYAGIAALDFYLVYRAMVRAKIHGLRAKQNGNSRVEASRLENTVDDYIALAQRLTEHERPALVLMHGFSASGKSRVAAALVESFCAIRIRSDVERKRLFGLDAGAHSDSEIAAGLYAADATDRTYKRLAEIADMLLDTGHSVIVDAAFLAYWQRKYLFDVAAARGASFVIVDCIADDATLRGRIHARTARGDDPSEATPAVLDYQLATHDPFSAQEKQAVVRCDTSGREHDHVARCIARVASKLAHCADSTSRI